MIITILTASFNGGSALAANSSASMALAGTTAGAAGGMMVWLALDAIFRGAPSAGGAAIGVIVGLVGATPACGYVHPLYGGLIGVLSTSTTFGAIGTPMIDTQ